MMPGGLAPLNAQERGWIERASRTERDGWIHVRIAGEPFERGFQYGYLTAAEYAEAMRVYQAMTYCSMGMHYTFFTEKAASYHLPSIERAAPELLEEMRGIAAGYTRAGVPTTLAQIAGWNAYEEMTGYWWPTVAAGDGTSASSPRGMARSHGSAFIATGSATQDGQIVLGHQSFNEFWSGQFMNVILDISPAQGQRMVMQTSPGWIASMSGFWLTGAGLLVAETTGVGCAGYDVTKLPQYVRSRKAYQYASNLEEWGAAMAAEQNGGYANMWLVGDIERNRIARYEQGLAHQNFEHKGDGCYFGDNVAVDPRIRNLERSATGYNDIRQQTGARRTRWPQLLAQHHGAIDIALGQAMLADTYDVYLKCINPSSRTICAHYDVDPMYYASGPDAVWNLPYFPGGSVDGKVTSAALARKLGLSARFGRADGVAFDAEDFLSQNPQWNWQQDYLRSRPSRPWVLFNSA